MNAFGGALWGELLKVRRSKMVWLTALGFGLIPAAGAFFMLILKNPEWAMQTGLVSTKARLFAGTADWPSYLGLLEQATGAAGMVLFGLIAAWVVGREYAERTAADLMALPTSRTTIVLAKFCVILLWSAALAAMVMLVGLAVGAALNLPPTTSDVFRQWWRVTPVAALMSILLVTPFAWLASVGRGYLGAVGGIFLVLVFAQLASVIGRGEYFPWSVPILYTGAAGPETVIGPVSFVIVAITSLAGVAATLWYWARSDQIV
jgi:ABC-2 type transport system permease protein